MAGTALGLTIDDKQLQQSISAIIKRMGSPEPALEIIGATVKASVQRNFEVGGRPEGWEPLSPATMAQKKGGGVLVQQGYAGGLLGSINVAVDKDQVRIGTNKIYAAIHQFGGKAGPGRKVSIPARPFLMVQDEDWDEINAALQDYLLSGKE
jgi:phage virion morphogenesis protein